MADKVGIVVQARFGSTRLPGKALLPIDGKPLLQRLCDRVRDIPQAQLLLVATSDQPADEVIAQACHGWGVPVVRGPETDLVARLLGACQSYDLTALVRVTGDNPLTDPDGIAELISCYLNSGADLVHNKHRRGYPYGTGAEVIAASALQRCSQLISDPVDREDFITWMRSKPSCFRCLSVSAPAPLVRPDYFLTVDYPQDLELFCVIYCRFGLDDRVSLRDVVQFLDQHPEVAGMNQHLHTGFPD